MQFSLWLLRYVCTFTLFILGMKAPGLPHKPYMLLVNEEERDVENSRVSPRAVWGGVCRGPGMTFSRRWVPGGDCLPCAPPATAAGCRQDRLYLEGFPEEAEPAGAIHVAEGQPQIGRAHV